MAQYHWISWLADDLPVYISPVKELHYYSSDIGHNESRFQSDYFSLFEEANENHLVIDETSARYLFSESSVSNIASDFPEARFIVLLRNPVEMTPSLYEQMLFSGDGNIKSFEQA